MSKRLRKKRHLGEFSECGFHISLELRPDLTEAEVDAWYGDLIDAIEGLNLGIGGGGSHKQEFFCARLAGRAPVMPEDREALGQWQAHELQAR